MTKTENRVYLRPMKPLAGTKDFRLGFLATQFDESYQYAVWNGAVEEAAALGLHMIFFEGSNIDTRNKAGSLDRTAFSLAAKTDLDGLVVMTNTMGATFSRDRIAGYLSEFSEIPVILIGVEFPGVPSISADTSGGISMLTEHLFQVHGRRKFLFLSGPHGHPESEQRKKEFLKTLATVMPLEARPHIVYGDFLEDLAYRRILQLIKDGWNWDAIVAANDQMAMGAIRALEEQGITVPGDVSVTGFDDIEDSRYSIPPLTTIHQPSGILGKRAIRFLASRLGIVPGEPEEQAGLTAIFIARESCGCMPPSPKARLISSVNIEHHLRYQVSRRVSGETRSLLLRRVESALIGSFKMEDILKEFAEGLHQLGIHFCAVVLFDTKGEGLEWSELMMLAEGSDVRVLAPYGLKFRTSEILPAGLPEEKTSFVCEPLQFGEEQIGYLMCSADSQDRHVYAALRDILSTSIKGAMVMAVERNREKALERDVSRRTVELSLTNKQLKNEIAQRKILEREILDVSNNIMSRIGQDIHDDLCQDIAGIGVLAAALEDALDKKNLPEESMSAHHIAVTAVHTARVAKKIARDLYPVDLEDNGIVNAVRRLVSSRLEADKAAGKDIPHITLDIHEGFFVRNPQKALQLFRIIQEALSNSLRHSEASRMKVGMFMDHGMVTVEVVDNGRGIDSTIRDNDQGMGMKIMRYRANMISGQLRVQSSHDGTSVSCRVSR